MIDFNLQTNFQKEENIEPMRNMEETQDFFFSDCRHFNTQKNLLTLGGLSVIDYPELIE